MMDPGMMPLSLTRYLDLYCNTSGMTINLANLAFSFMGIGDGLKA